MTDSIIRPAPGGDGPAGFAWLRACCWLFVPGDRPDRFDRACGSAAPVVIIDLEASVIPARKAAARAHLRAWLQARPDRSRPVLVRVNPVSTPWLTEDLAALADLSIGPGLGVMLPMAADAAQVAAVGEAIRPEVALVPLIESAAGILNAPQLARVPGIGRLAFGNMDYQTDIGSDAPQALIYPSSVLVAASRAAGLLPPMAGVTAAFRDADRLQVDLASERGLGFGGKLCIHPDQIEPILTAFRPTAGQLDRARRVLAAARDSHAVEIDGELVDRPVIDRARRLLEQHGVADDRNPDPRAGREPA